jgi:hypothetical protein
MLKLAIVGYWAALTVAPRIHPVASDMVLAPTGWLLVKMLFTRLAR